MIIKRINNILNYKYEKLDKITNLNIDGNIVIKGLEFSYNNKTKVINNIRNIKFLKNLRLLNFIIASCHKISKKYFGIY